MCGIAGQIRFDGETVNAEILRQMANTINHRGPDHTGFFIQDNIGICHLRLSIIDLSSAGNQPMQSLDGRYQIVFNGEIYNYLELKDELLQIGHKFITQTDTEVLLTAYIQWGVKSFSKLNGDFAFVIYDSLTKQTIGVRDRFGIKPFYLNNNSKFLCFASEIKALLPILPNVTPNNLLVYDYLVYGRTDHTNGTFFNEVQKLPAGHYFILKNSQLNFHQWYQLEANVSQEKTIKPSEYFTQFQTAVALRLRSDVPLGVCLSGGIDSSAITSLLLTAFKLSKVQTFSVIFPKNKKIDESTYVNQFKSEATQMHFATPTATDFFAEFQTFIQFQTEPIPSPGPYLQSKVFQLANKNVKVTLDGQGADEMLGGYKYFYAIYLKELVLKGRFVSFTKHLIGLTKNGDLAKSIAYLLFYLLPTGLRKYLFDLNAPEVATSFKTLHYKQSSIVKDLYGHSSVHQSFLKHFKFKLAHLLKWDDLNAMRASVESRTPFLDHHLVEATLSLSADHVFNKGTSKYILRESMKAYIPQVILNRKDKKGFDTPAAEWLRSPDFQIYIHQLLNSKAFSQMGYFNVKKCKQQYMQHLNQRSDCADQIWRWINIYEWHQHFIQKTTIQN